MSAIGIHLGLIILLSGPLSVCFGEINVPLSGYSTVASADSAATKKISSSRDLLTKLPSPLTPPIKQSSQEDDTEDSLYLAVYLNSRMLTEVIEAKDKGGQAYFNLNEIAVLIESTPQKNTEALATPEALNTLFPADFVFSSKHQALFIKGRGKLPIEQRWERERRQKLLAYNTIADDTPIVNFDYGLLGRPSFDISASYLKNGADRFNYSFKGTSEALYGTVNVFGRGLDNEKLTDLRVSWERFHPDWFVRAGDIVAPPIDLVSQAEVGRGISFSTFSMENASQFDTETLTGDLLDGWEVELYRGNTLLDFRKSDGSGRFVFTDIPLLFGENNLILKFYGPQGQTRQETRSANIGRSMVPDGQLRYRFSAMERGENILLGRNSQTRAHVKGFMGFGEAFYGLTQNLTMTGSLTSVSLISEERALFAKVGFLASYFGSSIKMDLITDNKGGTGFQSAFLRNIFGWGAQYRHVEFFDLKTDREPNLKKRNSLKLNKAFGGVFLELSAERRTDTFDVTRYKYKAKVSGSVNRFMLTHDLQANSGGGTQFVRGDLIATGRIHPKLLLRTHLNYDVHPRAEIRNVRARLDYRAKKDLTLRLDVVKNMIGEKDYTISQSLLWEGKKIGLGVTGSYSSTGEYQAIASVTFSLSPDSTGEYHMHRRPSTNIGTVHVRVFLDHDQDGVYDSEKDELLENVRLEHQSDRSGENGMIAFKGPAYRLTQLKIDENSLPDPYMVTLGPVAVRPRPSHFSTFNIPVWETGEIEGRAEPGEQIELMADGKIIATTKAEFDGFFLFEKIRFQQYSVRRVNGTQRVEVNRHHPIARVQWKQLFDVAQN